MSETLKEIIAKLADKHNIAIDKDPAEMTADEYMEQKVKFFNDSVGNLNELDGYNCDICKNKGMIAYVSGGYERTRFCKCKTIRDTLSRAKRSGLGDILTDYTFAKYKDTEDWQKQIKQKAIEFCNDSEAKWFYIGGQVGCGKTFICTAIAGYLIKQGKDVKYMLWSEEGKRLKSLLTDSGEYQTEINKYKDAEVLYIDDFLKVRNGESPTNGDINLAFEIINNRLIDKSKITIISSEKTLNEIMEYDEATMSRIYEKTGKYKINIPKDPNKNYRMRG